MAGLSEYDYDSAVETVALPGGKSFTVRGVALSDIAQIFRLHSAAIEAYFTQYMVEKEVSGDPKYAAMQQSTKFSMVLLEQAPDLAAQIIATASDEPHMAHRVRGLSFAIQLDALKKIGDLTFIEEDSAKKAFETVLGLIQGVNPAISQTNPATPENGFTASGDK